MATILTLTIVVAFTLNYALSAGTVTIVPASFVETVSYTVWEDGGTYYAKNGLTGAVDYSGTNASKIILNAHDTLASGSIKLLDAIYNLDIPLSLSSNISLIGSSYKTILKASTNFPNNYGIIRNKEATIKNIIVENLLIDGNRANGIEAFGITFGRVASTDSVNGITIRNVYVQNCHYHGIAIRPYSENIWIENSVADSNTHNGMDIQGLNVNIHYLTKNVWIVNCKGINNEYAGFDINGGAHNIWLINPLATGNSWGNHMNDAAIIVSSKCYDVTIENMKVYDNGVSTSAVTFGVKLGGEASVAIKGGKIFSTDASNDLGADGLRIMNGANVTITGLEVINKTARPGIAFTYVTNPNLNAIVTNCRISNVHTGIQLTNTSNCIISNNIISEATYGIREIAGGASDYNIIIGCSTRDCTNGILIDGTNTKVNLCWNASSWIA